MLIKHARSRTRRTNKTHTGYFGFVRALDCKMRMRTGPRSLVACTLALALLAYCAILGIRRRQTTDDVCVRCAPLNFQSIYGAQYTVVRPIIPHRRQFRTRRHRHRHLIANVCVVLYCLLSGNCALPVVTHTHTHTHTPTQCGRPFQDSDSRVHIVSFYSLYIVILHIYR